MNNTKKSYASTVIGAWILTFLALALNTLLINPSEGDLINLLIYSFIGLGGYLWGFINGDEGAHEADRE